MQTILGAGGVLGTYLAKELSKYTDHIRLVSRAPKRVNPNDELFALDLCKRSAVYTAVEGSEIVYVTIGFPYSIKIWQKNWPIFIYNVIGACKLYNAKLVFLDNVYMYDKSCFRQLNESSKCNPPSRKGQVRAKVSEMIIHEMVSGNLQAIIARAPDFLDGHNSLFYESVVRRIKSNKHAFWFVNADVRYTTIYTPDAAKAVALLGNTPDAYHQVWHLPAVTEKLTCRDYVYKVAELLGKEPKLTVLSKPMVSLSGLFVPVMSELKEMLYQYGTDYVFDSSKFRKRFNFIPTSIDDAIKELLDQSV
jgi:nucleoside-diphosphate-sugar epimerase